jgi:alpha-N-arabinofuranosidase
LAYQLYGEHFPGLTPVAVSGNSPQPQENPSYIDEPKVSSGSPTYPLDMFAAISADHKFLTVSVVNATESEQKVELNVSGVRLSGRSTLWQLTAGSLDGANRAGEPPQVQVKETSIASAPQTITVAPISVNIYRFAVQ